MPPRLVRRAPLSERISAHLNPLDVLLNISTWFSSYDWDGVQYSLATPMGVILNISCLIARASSNSNGRRRGADDVLRRSTGGTSMDGWAGAITYSFYLLSWALATLSLVNTIYCFTKTRPYRLFEANIEIQPQTPSARRVRVDSSPSNSPIKRLGNLIEPFLNTPESREHPSTSSDVWEVSIWDPTPLSLRIFGLFSPAHVAIYFLSFPLTSSLSYNPAVGGYVSQSTMNPYSVILTVLVTQFLLSTQLIYVQKCFVQQERDKALLSKQLMHEYDTKYVHPRLNTVKRDVGIQTSNPYTGEQGGADLYAPMLARQGFKTAPNPNYAELTMHNHISPFKHNQDSPLHNNYSSFNSPLSTRGPIRQPQFGTGNIKRSVSSGTSTYDSGSEEATIMSRRRETGFGSNSRPLNLARESSFGEQPRRGGGQGQSSTGVEAHIPSSNYGMHGLVNMSQQNSRNLSPSKMPSPFKRGTSARPSTYAGSLTPGRR